MQDSDYACSCSVLPSFFYYFFFLSSGCPPQLHGVKYCFSFCPESWLRKASLRASLLVLSSGLSQCLVWPGSLTIYIYKSWLQVLYPVPLLHPLAWTSLTLASQGCACQGPRLGLDKPQPFSPSQACPRPYLWASCWGSRQNQHSDRSQTDWMYMASQCRLLSFQLPFSQLEGALSKWTSYQDDVRQFSSWMDSVEASLNESERQYAEVREKTAALGKVKVGPGFQIPFVFWQVLQNCHSCTEMCSPES